MRVCVYMCMYVHKYVCIVWCVYTQSSDFSCVLYAFLGVVHTDEELRSALSLILPDSGYVICPGIPVDRYEDCFAVLHCHTKGVQVLQFQLNVTKQKRVCDGINHPTYVTLLGITYMMSVQIAKRYVALCICSWTCSYIHTHFDK